MDSQKLDISSNLNTDPVPASDHAPNRYRSVRRSPETWRKDNRDRVRSSPDLDDVRCDTRRFVLRKAREIDVCACVHMCNEYLLPVSFLVVMRAEVREGTATSVASGISSVLHAATRKGTR